MNLKLKSTLQKINIREISVIDKLKPDQKRNIYYFNLRNLVQSFLSNKDVLRLNHSESLKDKSKLKNHKDADHYKDEKSEVNI